VCSNARPASSLRVGLAQGLQRASTVPTITNDEIDRVCSLLHVISESARVIWDKAPNVGALGATIERLSQSVCLMLNEVEARDSDRAPAPARSRPSATQGNRAPLTRAL
jgi:hypothetical protein